MMQVYSSFPSPCKSIHLCEQCCIVAQQIEDEKPMRANGKMIRPYWPKSTLNISADTGCHLCARMLGVIAGWRSTVVDMLDPTWRCSYYSVVWNFSKGKPAGRTLEMYCDIPEVTDRRVGDIPMSEWKKENKVYFKIWDFEDWKNSKEMFAENISESTSDLMFVEQWLRKCDQGHAGCLESASDELEARWRPSRLLKIEQVLPGKVSKLSICEDLSDSPVQYMTLSHCWGTSRPLQLVEKSLLLFRNCIPLSEVPKAFMEACEITLRLGVSFIWIDSLCIIQDSEEDWLRESSMMATIYSHSYLNLAAAHSAGSSDGLFSVRNPDAIGPWPIRSKDSDGSLKLFILQESDSLSLLQASRLNHRAWVLQEQVLAPRTLYFTSGTLIWQCEEICASEGRPNGFGSHPKIGCLKHDLMIIDKRTLEDDWFQYVRLFSEREITKNTDRLIAISAIAYRLMRQYQLTESDYLAGLWRPSMPLSLLWLSNKHNERLWTRPWKRYEKPVKYCAPSWSWASHNRGVYMINWGITVANALLIDVYITPVAEQLGSVRDGYLRIQGILVKIQLGFYRDGIRTRRHVGFELDETPVSGLSLYLDYDPSKGNSPVREHQRYDIYLFEIGRSPNQSTYSRGLVLEKEKVKGTYSRIGIYSKALQPDGPDSQPHRPSDYNLELDDFEESSGSDLYVIKII